MEILTMSADRQSVVSGLFFHLYLFFKNNDGRSRIFVRNIKQ